MAEEVYREIYLFTRRRVPPIDIVYGSALPVTLKLMDYTIPAGATVMVYASVDREKVYQQAGTASGNTVQFTPGYGFFAPGRNELQIAINGNKIPLALAVNCEALLPEISDPTSTPEAVRPMVEEAREILKQTKEVAVKTPYVGENGNWYVWDTATGAFKDSGEPSKGDKGDAFTYADFTPEQLADLKGPKGDAFTYADFTPEQLADLKGPKGDAFEYSDFTSAQLAALKGDPGTPATVTSTETVYQAGTSGTEAPTGTWSETVPTVPQGQYLWTRVTTQFNTGDPVISYSVSRFGVDGSGSVVSVNGVGPDNSGNIQLTAADIPAGNNQTVGEKLAALDTGVSNAASAASAAATAAQTAQTTAEGAASAAQTAQTTAAGAASTAQTAQEAANSAATAAAGKQDKITATGLLKGTGSAVEEAQAGVDYQAPMSAGAGIKIDGSKVISTAAAPRNLLDNSDFTNLVAQAGIGGNHGSQAYAADRWKLVSGTVSYTAGTGLTLNGTISQTLERTPGTTSAFVGVTSGTATITISEATVTIQSNGGVLKWAALYKGTYTVANLPEYQPKGYGVELAECQRYYVSLPFNDTFFFGNSGSSDGTGARLVISLPVQMRTNPSTDAITVSVSMHEGIKSNIVYTLVSAVCKNATLSLYGNFGSVISASPTYINIIAQLRNNPLELIADL